MKRLLTALVVVMSAIAFWRGTCAIARKGTGLGAIAPWGAALCAIVMAHPALANEENVSPAIADQGQAGFLITEPATITSETVNLTNRTNNLKKVSESIGVVREQGCKKINPLELIKAPANTLKQCLEETNNQAAQINQTSQPTEKFDFFKVPELESGINVTVTKF